MLGSKAFLSLHPASSLNFGHCEDLGVIQIWRLGWASETCFRLSVCVSSLPPHPLVSSEGRVLGSTGDKLLRRAMLMPLLSSLNL